MNTGKKTNLAIPIAAFCLVLIPVPVIYFLSRLGGFAAAALFPGLLSPIAGLVMGVFYLGRGKDRINRLGKILAVTAIVLPLSLLGFIAVFFFGAVTGLIPLM